MTFRAAAIVLPTTFPVTPVVWFVRSARRRPPTVLPGELKILTPLRPLPSATVPLALVPMESPAMTLPVAPPVR